MVDPSGVATYSAVMEKIFGTPGRRVFDMSQVWNYV